MICKLLPFAQKPSYKMHFVFKMSKFFLKEKKILARYLPNRTYLYKGTCDNYATKIQH